MIRWPPPVIVAVTAACCRTLFLRSWRGESVRDNSLCFLLQGSEGIWKSVVDRIRRTIGDSTVELPRKTGIIGVRHKVVIACWHLCLAPTGITRTRLFSVDCGSLRQSGPRPDPRLLRQAALEALTRSARTDSPNRTGRKRISGDNGRRRRRLERRGGAAFVLGFRV
ncbi:hypothetical protein F511_42769 [Dorcoceras hygrometricum]|uniref:Uncharacterized protein n=1 Tax=Dorcoceras hygrometricum TaxID=472368 RepID=A0A2Z7B669_9LAMI|nr:hypothetical protein F511_42769 [Dorcoceras hygrometricum]